MQALYAKQIPTPGEYKAARGNRSHDTGRTHHIWHNSTVLRILCDERYIGTYIMGKREVIKFGGSATKCKDKSDWFMIPEHHKPIIEKAVFEQVQARLKHFSSTKKNRNEFPLRGKIFCGCCEHTMYRVKRLQSAFLCRHTKVAPSQPCHGLKIPESKLETMLFDIISKQAQVILGAHDTFCIKRLDAELAQKNAYEKQIQDLCNGKQHLHERFSLQEIDEQKYRELKSALDNKLSGLNQVYATLSSKTAQMRLDSKAKTELQEVAQSISQQQSLTREIADSLIDRVYVFPDKRIQIDWKIASFCG